MPTTIISLNAMRDRQAIEQIITTLDHGSPLRRQLESLLTTGRGAVQSAQLVGLADLWVLKLKLVGGHPVYHLSDTAGGSHKVISEAAALALAGDAL